MRETVLRGPRTHHGPRLPLGLRGGGAPGRRHLRPLRLQASKDTVGHPRPAPAEQQGRAGLPDGHRGLQEPRLPVRRPRDEGPEGPPHRVLRGFRRPLRGGDAEERPRGRRGVPPPGLRARHPDHAPLHAALPRPRRALERGRALHRREHPEAGGEQPRAAPEPGVHPDETVHPVRSLRPAAHPEEAVHGPRQPAQGRRGRRLLPLEGRHRAHHGGPAEPARAGHPLRQEAHGLRAKARGGDARALRQGGGRGRRRGGREIRRRAIPSPRTTRTSSSGTPSSTPSPRSCSSCSSSSGPSDGRARSPTGGSRSSWACS